MRDARASAPAAVGEFDAIVLAGGRAVRLGGLVKPALRHEGRRLVDIALAAASGARRRVVVGDVEVPDGVLRTRERPAFGGPVAATEAGLRALPGHAEWTLVLASDVPDAEAAVEVLLAAPVGPDDGVCLISPDGRRQWLLGCYRTAALLRRLGERGDPSLTAMHLLLAPLRIRAVDPGSARVDDVDSPEDVERWGIESP